jgi:hypothetical protein
MYEYSKSIGPDRSNWYQGRLRSNATKSSLKEMSLDLKDDEKMLSEQEEWAIEVLYYTEDQA